MCSFDISSLFTNVPLEETINICADALYCNDSDAQPLISKAVFIELMKSATSGVEFNFNDIMYKQTDGVAIGSPLGPALTNIFVGFYEEKLFSQISKPFHILGTLMIHLLCFAMKKSRKTFSNN